MIRTFALPIVVLCLWSSLFLSHTHMFRFQSACFHFQMALTTQRNSYRCSMFLINITMFNVIFLRFRHVHSVLSKRKSIALQCTLVFMQSYFPWSSYPLYFLHSITLFGDIYSNVVAFNTIFVCVWVCQVFQRKWKCYRPYFVLLVSSTIRFFYIFQIFSPFFYQFWFIYFSFGVAASAVFLFYFFFMLTRTCHLLFTSFFSFFFDLV